MKSKTYFIDIDGVIFKHRGLGASHQWTHHKLLQCFEFFDRIEAEGACIILITARKESNRALLENWLLEEHIFYDQLIMGITQGELVIINDKKPKGRSCKAITIKRNVGLDHEALEKSK